MSINQQIDQIADEFEAAWQAGESPKVADYLARVGHRDAVQLLKVLIPLDVTYHRHQDAIATPDDYSALGTQAVEIARRELVGTPAISDSDALQETVESPLQDAIPGTTLPTPRDGGVDLTLTFLRVGEPPDQAQAHHSGTTGSQEVLSPGQKINDRYLVEREVGRGGMGAVFLGFDTQLQRKVAIKTIQAELTSSPSGSASKRAFEEEARIGAGLLHPAIATVYDYGFMGETAYTVFEYVAGQPMRNLIRDSAPLPIDDVRKIVGAIAEALDYAHARGIVHRDLKPENICFTELAQPKILDLGLAVRFKDASSWRFAGTPAYASPEQAAEYPSDGRADQYSLAVIAYEMLSGRRPFQAKSAREMLQMQISATPIPIAALRSDLPGDFSEAMNRAMSKAPNERFGTCTEFAEACGSRTTFVESTSDDLIVLESVLALLQADSIWFWPVNREMECWPRNSIKNVKQVLSKGLNVELSANGISKRHTIVLRSSEERDEWETKLRFKCEQPELPLKPDWRPTKQTLLVLDIRPGVPYQSLGSIESEDPRKGACQRSLVWRAAIRGADAIVECRSERLVDPVNSLWRTRGTAIKTLDSKGHSQLVARVFAKEMGRLVRTILATIICTVIGGMVGLWLNSGNVWSTQFSVFGLNGIVFHLWPVLMCGMFLHTRIPQLANGTAVALLGLGIAPSVSLATAIAYWIRFNSSLIELIPAFLFALFVVPMAIHAAKLLRRLPQRFKQTFANANASTRTRSQLGATVVLMSVVYLAFVVKASVSGIYSAKFARGFTNLAYAELQGGRYVECIEHATRALLLDDSLALAYVNRAAGYLGNKQPDRALEDCNHAIALDSQSLMALINRTTAYLRLGDIEHADADAKQVLTIDPGNELAISNFEAVKRLRGSQTRDENEAGDFAQ